MILSSVLATYAVDDKMGMDMLPVYMGGDQDLVAAELFLGKAQSDLVRRFRRELFLRGKGLHEVIVHPPVRFSVLHFGIHHFAVDRFGHTVYAGRKAAVAVSDFALPLAVGEDERETGSRLQPFALQNIYRCHPLTSFVPAVPTAVRSSRHTAFSFRRGRRSPLCPCCTAA